MKRSAVLFSLAVLACMTFACSAQAYDGFSGYGIPWFGYGNSGPAAYALGNIPAPPYFALHPPVYYSHPVARTYGGSPYACSCDCHRMAHHPAPRVVTNPRVEIRQSKPAAKPAADVAAHPVRIANPYYRAESPIEKELVSN